MRLSILICSLKHRETELNRLLTILNPQLTVDVEVLVETDGGELTIGGKRNILLNKAVGDYVCFIDDDDIVSNDYVSKILKAIETNPDCVGIEGEVTFNGNKPKKFIQSIRYNKWFEENNIYCRCPNHLSPVKREIALQVMFPEISFQEDRVYSARIYSYLKKESFIDGIIYFYKFIKNKQDQSWKYRVKTKGVDIEPMIRDWGRF